MNNEVYLDYNGSAPLDPRVAETTVPLLQNGVGNASSSHHFGQRQAAFAESATRMPSTLWTPPSSWGWARTWSRRSGSGVPRRS